ncbi:MAG: hypothetical protein QOE82_3170 [Thermoanaerobaculia bacterium]|nr:hypothetical protein [Thermoanaerobaculia bacterium]
MTFFTIVVPSFNRERLIARAIDSVLAQVDADFENVVVDSASTDNTRNVVRDYAARDARIRLVREETRRGVCAARNLGIANAHGEWIVPLDTDDELPAGTLAMFRRHIAGDPNADHHRYLCRWDDGSISPTPPFRDEVWDYDGYLRFLNQCENGRGETMSCIRASTFAEIRYPETRAYETIYHLDFARRHLTHAHPEVARLYHTDAEDQNSFVPNPQHWLRVAPDVAASLNDVLARHGAALARTAPRAYADFLRTTAKFNFLAGDRRRGAALLRRLWSKHPLVPISWIIFIFGMLGRVPLAWIDSVRFRIHWLRVRA